MTNFVSLFNQFLASLILFLWSLLVPLLPRLSSPLFVPRLVIPPVKLEQIASASAILKIPEQLSNETIQQSSPNVPWGTTEKIGEHEYRTYVGSDPVMGAPSEILDALNVYRRNHNVGQVRSDENICKLALWRAQVQQQEENLDGHKGLIDYMNDQSHWKDLNIKAIGENASYGYVLSGTHLIEWVFDSDVEHRDNQLNPQWNLACAGTSGVTMDIIFGQR